MAALVWSGTGTWDNSNTANWSPAQVPVAGDTITLAASSTGTITIGTGAICGTLDLTNAAAGFTLAFGTNKISLSGTSTATVFTGSTAATVTGTPLIEISWGAGNATINATAMSEANSISFSFISGSGNIIATGSIRDFTITSGSTRSMSNAVTTFYGNVNIASTATWTRGSGTRTMAATSGTKTITSNGLLLDSTWTFDGVGGTFQLVDALTCSWTVTLTNGTLNLNNNNLTCSIFSTSNSNVRTLTVGTGLVYITGTGTVYNASTSTNLTYTTTPTVIATSSSATSRSFQPGTSLPIDLQVTAGTGSLNLASSSVFRNVDFTGATGSIVSNSFVISGNLTIGSATWSSGANTTTFNGVGTQLLDFGSSTVDRNLAFTGSGTYRLLSNLTLATARALTVTTGTFDSNDYAVTVPTLVSTGSGVRGIIFGSSTWTITNATATAWNVTSPTNFTATPNTGKISMSAATAKSFVGGGKTYPTIENSGMGALTIDGGNTFNNIAATLATSFIFTSGTTTTFLDWTMSGTAGNLVSLTATSPGTRATITKASGTVSVDYLNIRDSNATVATWDAGSNSIDSGNNLGWILPATGFFFLYSA